MHPRCVHHGDVSPVRSPTKREPSQTFVGEGLIGSCALRQAYEVVLCTVPAVGYLWRRHEGQGFRSWRRRLRAGIAVVAPGDAFVAALRCGHSGGQPVKVTLSNPG